jgi:sugar O-acyltransferase (sialic acid O-acetyltransferase NeuD family)
LPEKQDLLLFPCNGNAVEALDCLGEDLRPIGFVDDDPAKISTTVYGLPVHGRGALRSFPGAQVLAVPGSPTSFARRAWAIASLGIPRERFATVLHPAAIVSRYATIGVNVLVMGGAVVTASAVVEDHVIVLPNAVIHHDSCIEPYSVVGSGVLVAGYVRIGQNSYIGSGSRVGSHVTIAPGTLVGMASTVLRSIPEPRGVWVGNPARFLRPVVSV